jgi:ATP-dependent DNA helicase PIF1
LIQLPERIASKMSEKCFIEYTFPEIRSPNFDANFSNRVMVAATNKKTDELNEIATDLMCGEEHVFQSFNQIIKDSQQALFPTEFLNQINISGMPPHKLRLKIGQPIIMLRNLNSTEGLCNGTRLIVTNLHSRLIEAKISFGSFAEKLVFIPRLPLMPSDTNLPFDFTRTQFPIRPAFCITINKSQGQTLDFISIWLGDDHVFTHGQLYVALSRVSSISQIKIAINNQNRLTRNVVFNEVFE